MWLPPERFIHLIKGRQWVYNFAIIITPRAIRGRGLLQPVICKLHSIATYTIRIIKFMSRAPHLRHFSIYSSRFFFPYRNLNVITVSLIVWFPLIGFADCIHCTGDPRIVKAVAFETVSLKTMFVSTGRSNSTDRNCGATGSISRFIGRHNLLHISVPTTMRND